jgi:hypothetical protein
VLEKINQRTNPSNLRPLSELFNSLGWIFEFKKDFFLLCSSYSDLLQDSIEVNGVNLEVTFFLEQFIHVTDE